MYVDMVSIIYKIKLKHADFWWYKFFNIDLSIDIKKLSSALKASSGEGTLALLSIK